MISNITPPSVPSTLISSSDIWTAGLVSGIVSSILASFFIWIMFNLYRYVLRPKLQRIFYSGINISGVWNNKIEIEQGLRSAEGIMELEQNGSNIKGRMTITNKKGETQTSSIYILKGKIYNNFIQLRAVPFTNKSLSISSAIFIIKNDGKKLEGSSVVIDSFSSEVVTHSNVIWELQNNTN